MLFRSVRALLSWSESVEVDERERAGTRTLSGPSIEQPSTTIELHNRIRLTVSKNVQVIVQTIEPERTSATSSKGVTVGPAHLNLARAILAFVFFPILPLAFHVALGHRLRLCSRFDLSVCGLLSGFALPVGVLVPVLARPAAVAIQVGVVVVVWESVLVDQPDRKSVV